MPQPAEVGGAEVAAEVAAGEVEVEVEVERWRWRWRRRWLEVVAEEVEAVWRHRALEEERSESSHSAWSG